MKTSTRKNSLVGRPQHWRSFLSLVVLPQGVCREYKYKMANSKIERERFRLKLQITLSFTIRPNINVRMSQRLPLFDLQKRIIMQVDYPPQLILSFLDAVGCIRYNLLEQMI